MATHLPIKAICNPRAKRDGTNLISIQYCQSPQKRTVLPTDIYIPRAFWNSKQRIILNRLPLDFGDAGILNNRLNKLIRRAQDLVYLAKENNFGSPIQVLKKYHFTELTLEEIKEKELQNKNEISKLKASNLDLYHQIDDYIQSKTKKVCKDMPRIYRNMKEHLLEFQAYRGKPITFESLNLTFYEEFVDFLMYEYVQRRRKEQIVGLKVNTVGKTVKQFRTFLRNRIRKGIIPPIDMDGWKILEEEVDAVYLTWAEIKKVYEVDLTKHPHLIDYRNDFVLGCMTGLRFSDFSKLLKEDLRGDMLYKKQQKSDHWVVIPLRPEAREILQHRFNKNIPPPTNAEFNRHIKNLAKLAGISENIKHSHKKGNKDIIEVKPKYAWITSHTCRRSFCTNEFLAGTPVELIMKISGHKSVKDFYKYIRVTPEEAGQKIKKLWMERDGMRVFG